MTDMVEVVARALAGHFGPFYDDLPRNRLQLREWQRIGQRWDHSQEDMRDAALQVIKSMREIEIPVQQAGGKLLGAYMRDTEYHYPVKTAIDIWEVMIDSILKQENGREG